MDAPVKILVGLGNPGAEYENTRHNAGEDFVRLIAEQYNITLKQDTKYFGFYGKGIVNNRDIKLLIPTTFMNRSGKSIAALANFFKVEPKSILVAHDELDMEPGVARLKVGGGHGGHNGLRDTISALGNSKDFARLRLGIGHPGNAKMVSGYVLKKAPTIDRDKISEASYQAAKVLPQLMEGKWNQAMQDLHTAT
ncbi:aminoacyl-tRNA hydrolase [Sessilibacter corallicola]|uniref:aminoacyl-tRNA hydrolase n=1 Tax=Sessilibacter corallicola TaxID=2904075 RepID=UPI001E4D28CA|nr:aminoacyl-tRNA hydrolase [Sessilibacter corallicola]MCE2027179.1 aminoacyl-tRNA hydrolase [Sessilibacter corallicola]